MKTETTPSEWERKYQQAIQERDKALRLAQQATLLARGWKQRAENAEQASATDQAIQELINDFKKDKP